MYSGTPLVSLVSFVFQMFHEYEEKVWNTAYPRHNDTL